VGTNTLCRKVEVSLKMVCWWGIFWP